ncbi:MAG TPA: phosphodiester glycosidase family protein [Gaiellaceae bacterium]|nr:phosphodiester glycosidase family protein [Gaiellaceae bacterium]
METVTPAVRRPRERRRPRRRWRVRRIVLLALLVVAAPAVYSYVTTMLKPSSLPLWPRSVEWLRQHHGNWLVDEVEHYYYSWKAPSKGGPQLKTLPLVGLGPAGQRAAAARARKAASAAGAWPRRIPLVFAHPLPGEGVWRRTGPLVNGRPPVLVTTFRTELDYPRIVAYVAWFDHTRTSVAWYPGRYEPPNAPVRGPFQVPFDQRWRLLATFNGGFIYMDGHNGSSIEGREYEPLQRGLATLIAYRDGRVDVRSWTGGPVAGPQIAFARQSLPLIVDGGKLNPNLNDSSQWGFTLGNAVRVWRTGAGIDRHGNLIYAAADYQTVTTLARILQRAGAVRAMQLDINPEWPTLITYTHHHGIVPTKIVPNYQQPATRYLVPDDRDFFAVYRRLPGPVTDPFK